MWSNRNNNNNLSFNMVKATAQPYKHTVCRLQQQSATRGSNDTADTLSRNNDVKTYKHIQLTRCISVISIVAESYGRPPTAQANKHLIHFTVAGLVKRRGVLMHVLELL